MNRSIVCEEDPKNESMRNALVDGLAVTARQKWKGVMALSQAVVVSVLSVMASALGASVGRVSRWGDGPHRASSFRIHISFL
jgi:hypothetical protein